MSQERGQLVVPSDTISSQSRAADPEYSIWVEANAGSGKTYVLTHRVLRLLLVGVQPQSILCLTYTKAAAAEMRRRVGARLAQWALAAPDALAEDVGKLIGRAPSAKMLDEARTLFARALETPGGLRILTIHAFCEAVLHRFPIEAGVPFDFSVIEEEQQTQMILSARESVLAEGLRGASTVTAVETLFGLMGDDAIAKAIASALGEGAKLRAVVDDPERAKQRLRALVGFGSASGTDIAAEIVANTALTSALWRELVESFDADPHKTRGARFIDLAARLDPKRLSADQIIDLFLTEKDGVKGPRANLLNAAQRKAKPDLLAALQDEQERLMALQGQLAAARLVERSEAVLDVVAAIRDRYEQQKRRHALLDFDDLVEKLGDLFANRDIGPWVQYKLDAGIDHILVDESQDTNERQWRVVRALADEFFSGDSAITRPRSLFAVGDQKQSIYSFQGAQPALFGETGRDMARRAHASGKLFADVRLHTSFRTLGGILAAVDRVCARADVRQALLSLESVGHAAARTQNGGRVVLWPPTQQTIVERDTSQWPIEPVETEQSAEKQVARRIARQIKGWIESGRMLSGRGRAVEASDILILVQKRPGLFHEIIRALRTEGVPTPGPDRLAVTGHIAVLDLLALIDVLLSPSDDLQLAALLRSPLFAVTEDDLFTLANGRSENQSLWSAVSASPLASAIDAATRLQRWRSTLDLERPFEFLSGVLYAEGGLKLFHARLGPEVDEVLSELLELALVHEQGEQPSLQGFAAEMRRRSVTIKRELADSGGGVRVMTVHGAKGLEAPIVILADAADKPSSRQGGKPVYILGESPGPLLIHAASKGQHVPATAAIRDEADAVQAEEYWRRLYVAMTRAEDELYVTGAIKSSNAETQLAGSWYEAIDAALKPDLSALHDDGGDVAAWVFPEASVESYASRSTDHQADVPSERIFASVPEPHIAPLVSPSNASESKSVLRPLLNSAEAVRDADVARREGLALHALLQHLVRVPSEQWAEVALKALDIIWPEGADHHAGIARKAISILSRGDLAHLFGDNSRAEVPFLVPALRDGEKVRLSGRIDRIVVTETRVLILDYKSDAFVPSDPGSVPGAYLTQLGIYELVAARLFPGRDVDAAILWTAAERLMPLPDGQLKAAARRFTLM